MSGYVLVHGIWHGAWCWEKVIPLLEREGHEVHAPDLPAHGEDRTALSEVSLDTYVDRVGESLAACSEPAMLVGHSLAGVIISNAAERFPDLISSLVYLTAFLLKDGQSRRQLPDVGVSLVQQNLFFDDDGSSVTVDPDVRIEAFYGDCSEADAQMASARLTPAPFAPLKTPVSITEERFGRLPRAYTSASETGQSRSSFSARCRQRFPVSKSSRWIHLTRRSSRRLRSSQRICDRSRDSRRSRRRRDARARACVVQGACCGGEAMRGNAP